MKTKTFHKHLRTIHWHGSMLLAIGALLITATKTSSEMLTFLQATSTHAATSSQAFREAETVHSSLAFGGYVRHASVSGQ